MTKLCVKFVGGGGRRRRRRRRARDTESKQEPHTELWGKTAERNFLYGYDVSESSSDVDATSSSSTSSESSAET